jgi:hypothetical protein
MFKLLKLYLLLLILFVGEAFKSFFGLTYDQMVEKNISTFYESLNIDHITSKGNIKYNISEPKRMSRHLKQQQEVVVLIHGFLESSEGVMVQGLSPAFMKQPKLMTLALDGRNVIHLEYFRSSTYTRFMGEHLGTFLSEIVKGKSYLISQSVTSLSLYL